MFLGNVSHVCYVDRGCKNPESFWEVLGSVITKMSKENCYDEFLAMYHRRHNSLDLVLLITRTLFDDLLRCALQ